MKSVGMAVLLLGLSSYAFAGLSTVAPEISSASAVSAIALVSGAILVIRGRRKR